MRILRNPAGRIPKAQAALEYFLIMCIAILVLAPIIINGWTYIGDFAASINFNKAHDSIKQIADAAKIVYFQGEPSAITITVSFPSNIVMSNVSGQEIYFRMPYKGGYTDVVEFLDFNVTGNISTESGEHDVYLEVNDNVVNITRMP